MTTIRRLAFLALLASFMAQPSCSWFQSHPVIPAVVTCSGETIPLALVTQVYSDVMANNWLDLATNVIPLLKDGYADLECIFNYLSVSNPEAAPHIKAMKAAHVGEFRGSVSLRSPSDSTPSAGPTLEKISENTGHGAGQGGDQPPHAHALAPDRHPRQGVNLGTFSAKPPKSALECDQSCGAPMSGLVTPSGCSCQRKVDGKPRWVPLATVAAR